MTATACITFDHGGNLGPFFALLDRRRVRGTFFLEGRHGEDDPATVAEVVARGHELGMHGWAHEAWAELGADEERALAQRATDARERWLQQLDDPLSFFGALAGIIPANAPKNERSGTLSGLEVE